MKHLTCPRIAAFVAALVISGCDDATSPRDLLAGTYALRSLDSQPVPVLQFDLTNTRGYLVADTIAFNGRGTITHTVVTRVDSVGRSYSAYQKSHTQGRYVIRGDTIGFPIDCPPSAMCVRPPVGWRAADGSVSIGWRTTTGLVYVKRYERIR